MARQFYNLEGLVRDLERIGGEDADDNAVRLRDRAAEALSTLLDLDEPEERDVDGVGDPNAEDGVGPHPDPDGADEGAQQLVLPRTAYGSRRAPLGTDVPRGTPDAQREAVRPPGPDVEPGPGRLTARLQKATGLRG